MASNKQVELRKKSIAKIIYKFGYTKKAQVVRYIQENQDTLPSLKGLSKRTYYSMISFDQNDEIIDTNHKITGRSVLKDKEGNKIIEWVKTSEDREKQEAAKKAALEELKSKIVPYLPTPSLKRHSILNLCNQYTITDYHLGLMTWAEETGEEWNMKIAEDMIVNWFEQGILSSPKASQAVFANIGDFLHWDGLDAVTPASKHVLDADTKYQHLVRVSIRVIRRVIHMLLASHDSVHLIMAEGNHDLASSAWLREVFSMYFEDEPRLTVDNNPDPYYCFTWGQVCLFYHHAHKKGIKALDAVFVAKFKKEFGSSTYVYGHTGHLHHQVVQESGLMTIEQHNTLAAKDSYASRGGYTSHRNSKVITYHKEFGEVGRTTINPDMLK